MLRHEVRHYLPNGKAYKLQTWYTDARQRPASPASAVTSKVKVARSRHASDRYWPISQERNVLETPKLVGRLSTPRAIMRTSFKVKGNDQGHQADIMLRPEVRHIFRTERPTNFKLGVQMEDEDPYRRNHHQQCQRFKIAMSRGTSDRCWPINLELKVPETSKLVSNYGCHEQQCAPVSRSKGQMSMLRLKVYHILGTSKLIR